MSSSGSTGSGTAGSSPVVTFRGWRTSTGSPPANPACSTSSRRRRTASPPWKRFSTRIRHDASTSYRLFTTDDELRQQVSDDLALLLTDRFVSSVEAGTEPVRRASPPAPRESILGREEELAELRALIEDPDVRLITLTGPGGVGKSDAGAGCAAQSSDRFKDAVAYVSLASTMDHKLILSAIAAAVGLPENDGAPSGDACSNTCSNEISCCWSTTWSRSSRSAPAGAADAGAGTRAQDIDDEPRAAPGSRRAVVPVAPLQVPPAGMQRHRGPRPSTDRTLGGPLHRTGTRRDARLRVDVRQRRGGGGDLPEARWHPAGDRTGSRAHQRADAWIDA